MKIYHYDCDGFYLGTSDAQESPLEPGVFLLPGLTTIESPQEPGEGERVRWNGESWTVEPIPLPPPPEPEPEPSPEEMEAARIRGIMTQIALHESRQPRALREYALAETALEKEGCRARLRLIDSEIENMRAKLCA